MSIDIDKLMRLPIPVVRQTLTPRDIAFYALSIGMGRDPLDARQLPYVDPLQGPKVMPAMVLVMAHPGFYLGHPDSGVDPKGVLHADQAIEITGTIPAEGEVESRTRITEVIDKGEGKAALILAETELSAEGAVFARLNRTTFIRGGGGFGGPSAPANPAPVRPAPEGPPDYVVDLDTGGEQALLYRLNGDLNPLHSDPELARKLGFERPILHGLCTMGVVCHALLRALGDYRADAMRKVSLRFSKPVSPGETIRTEIWNDGAFRASVPSRDAIVIEGGLAIFDKSNP
ncbi:MAG: MaoC/PaaZ C-terminal domain-containing protein [Amaricoccus sp.]|uniref:MaoC/PaaZ C-terminal domain-containing protein n=1 Tax=Amaricoccus sp. TaxID=1872485 RepID=UPI0039E2C5F4